MREPSPYNSRNYNHINALAFAGSSSLISPVSYRYIPYARRTYRSLIRSHRGRHRLF